MKKLLIAAIELRDELKEKNYPRQKWEAYLMCLLNIGIVERFIQAVDEAEKNGE